MTSFDRHPSAFVRRGTTLVPQAVEIVSALVRRAQVPPEQVSVLLAQVHAELVGAARSAAVISDDLHRLGYVASEVGDAPAMDVVGAAKRLAAPTNEPASPTSSAVGPSVTARPSSVDGLAANASSTPISRSLPAPSSPPDAGLVVGRTARDSRSSARAGKTSRGRRSASPPRQQSLPMETRLPRGVTVETSVRVDFIVCLEDGKKVRDLAAHLEQRHDISPSEYRRRWNLSPEYPMHAPRSIMRNGDVFEMDPATGIFTATAK